MPRIENRDRQEEAIAYASGAAGLAVAGGELVMEGAAWAGGRVVDLLREHHRRLHQADRQRMAGHAAIAEPGKAPLRLVETPSEEPVADITPDIDRPLAAA